jgi:hypothetical protein
VIAISRQCGSGCQGVFYGSQAGAAQAASGPKTGKKFCNPILRDCKISTNTQMFSEVFHVFKDF